MDNINDLDNTNQESIIKDSQELPSESNEVQESPALVNINDKPTLSNSEVVTDNCAKSVKCIGNSYFFTEVMSTAGPRKNFQDDAREGDFDLGEDVVGCFIRKDRAYFWLLDGTSDSPILISTDGKELFSSRLLAQELAWTIQQFIWENKSDVIICSSDILKQSFTKIQNEWQKKFNDLLEDDKKKLLEIIKDKTRLIVSTTVIYGTMSLDGNIDVSQIGDSYVITNPMIDMPDKRGRLFVILNQNNDNPEEVVLALNSFEDTRCHTILHKDVSTLVLASDGLSQNTIKWLKLKPADFTDPNFRKTISLIKQGTCDDKALCVIQILTDD